jgi:hypothetical protein
MYWVSLNFWLAAQRSTIGMAGTKPGHGQVGAATSFALLPRGVVKLIPLGKN